MNINNHSNIPTRFEVSSKLYKAFDSNEEKIAQFCGRRVDMLQRVADYEHPTTAKIRGIMPYVLSGLAVIGTATLVLAPICSKFVRLTSSNHYLAERYFKKDSIRNELKDIDKTSSAIIDNIQTGSHQLLSGDFELAAQVLDIYTLPEGVSKKEVDQALRMVGECCREGVGADDLTKLVINLQVLKKAGLPVSGARLSVRNDIQSHFNALNQQKFLDHHDCYNLIAAYSLLGASAEINWNKLGLKQLERMKDMCDAYDLRGVGNTCQRHIDIHQHHENMHAKIYENLTKPQLDEYDYSRLLHYLNELDSGREKEGAMMLRRGEETALMSMTEAQFKERYPNSSYDTLQDIQSALKLKKILQK